MTTPEPRGTGLPASLEAYTVSILGLAALVPASGRLLPERVTLLPVRTARAFTSRLGARAR